MKWLWFYIILSLIVQETASTSFFLSQARTHSLNVWLLHLIWLLATSLDVYLGYKIGSWVSQKLGNNKVVIWINTRSDRVKNAIGKRGEAISMFLLGAISFSYVNAFLGSWLKIDFKKILIFTVLGNLIWYITLWGVGIGIHKAVSDQRLAIYLIVAATLAIVLVYKTIFSKILDKN